MTDVLAIVQARLSSSRFPGKVVTDLDGRPLIRHVVDRVRAIPSVAVVVVATPETDRPMIAQAAGPGCCVFGYAGPINDVLGRFAAVVRQWERYETVMRITADCPLLNPEIAEAVVTLYRESGCPYAWNKADGYVDGEDVEVFHRHVLLWADQMTEHHYDREHVTPYIRHNFQIATLPAKQDRSGLKTSIDTAEDLERVRQMLEGECRTG